MIMYRCKRTQKSDHVIIITVEMSRNSTSSSWDSKMSQSEFMLKDQCVLLSFDDKVVGSQSKKTSHVRGTPYTLI
jgi:hypothetical protein